MSRGLLFSTNGQQLLSAGSNPGLAWWHVPSCNRLGTLQPSTLDVWACSPDARTLLVQDPSAWPHRFSLWDVATEKKLTPLAGPSDVLAVAFAAASNLLAISTRRALLLFDVGAGRQSTNTRLPLEPMTSLVYATVPSRALAFSIDGRLLFTGGRDRMVHVREVPSLRERAAWEWEIGSVHSLAVAADGLTAAAGGTKGRAVFCDLDV
jgi:WD40 repeat protein